MVTEGSTLPLAAVVHDGDGEVLEESRLVWQSSDPTTATVDAEGVVTGQAIGYVQIEAGVDGVTATHRIRVHDPGLEPGQMALRVMGAPGTATVVTGEMIFSDVLGTPDLDRGMLHASGLSASIRLLSADRLGTGELELGRWLGTDHLSATDARGYVDLNDNALGAPPGRWATVAGGTLSIEATYPPAGVETGMAAGILDMPVVRLVEDDPNAPSADTARIYAQFELPTRHEARAYVSAENLYSAGGWLVDGGGFEVLWETDADGPSAGGQLEGDHFFLAHVAELTVGVHVVERLTDADFRSGNWPDAFAWADFGTSTGGSVDGTISISEYTLPTVTLSGEVYGSIDLRLAVEENGVLTGDTISTNVTFAVPLEPGTAGGASRSLRR